MSGNEAGNVEVDVLVVGAGPVGLVAAAELGRLGVRTLLVDARTEPVPHPRARSINVRTNEILRTHGIEDAVRDVCLPVEWGQQMVFVRTLAGEEIGRLPMRTQGTRDGIEYSPCAWLLSSQDRLEPVLRRCIDRYPAVTQWWGCTLEAFTQDAAGVTAELVVARERRHVRARWLIGADGASSEVRRAIGATLIGRHGMGDLVNTQFYAELGPWTDHRPAALYWTTRPDNVFQKIDLDDRWLCQLSVPGHGREPIDPQRAAELIRASVGVTDLEVNVVNTIPWAVSCTVADRFRVGRVFLAGDAAHQLPPSGGFGMNTGVQDAHNLAWKLAFVLRGWAPAHLLETYEIERRPIARYNAERSLENGKAVQTIRRTVNGERPDLTRDAALEGVRRYTGFLGMDLGFTYEHGAFVPDGTDIPTVPDPVIDYRPSANPGRRAPHHWLRTRDGRALSTIDLCHSGFHLLAGPRGTPWKEVGDHSPVPLTTTVIGRDVDDPTGTWCEDFGVASDGAVLVRPDGIVAARWQHATTAPSAVAVIRRVLGYVPQ